MLRGGFQSFVAWRYLMARPRALSRPLVALIGAAALAALVIYGTGAGLEWWWRDHEKRPPFNPLVAALSHIHAYDAYGTWILIGAGAVFTAIGGVLARFRRGGRHGDLDLLPRKLGGAALMSRADVSTWRSTLGWMLIVAGVTTAGFGVGAPQMVAERTFVEWSPIWALIALSPLLILVPLTIFRYYFTFFTTVSMSGVFVGSMALVVVLSVMGGFETDLRDKILGSNAHIRVTRVEGMIADWQPVLDRVRAVPGVVAATPYATTEVVLSANNNYATVIIKGIDPETVGQVTELVSDIEGDAAEDAATMTRLYPLREDEAGEEAEPPAPDAPTPDAGAGDVVDPAPDDLIDVEAGGTVDYALDEPDAAPVAAPDDAGVAAPVDVDAGSDAPPTLDQLLDLDDRDRDLLDDDLPPARGGRIELLDGVLVGKELEKTLHLFVGQEVRLVSPLADPANPDATGTPIPFHRDYRIAGFFYTGMYEYDLKFVYVPLESLQEFLQLGDEIDGIEVRITDPEATDDVRAAIARALGPDYLVQDWMEMNRNLFSALKLEKIAMFLVLAIIILVASFSIIGNLIMVVVEKAKEIALLKTLGASDLGVMRVFIMQGFFIGVVGTLVGVAEGVALCFALQELGFPINPDVYYIKELPIHIEPFSVAAIAAAGFVISGVATVYPAWMAARLRPAIGLRHD